MVKKNYYNCGFELTLELIGGKWKSLILWKLNELSVLRYGELSRQIEGITQKMLTQQLKELDKSGLILRKVYNQIPPKVEYSLTPYGKQLCKIFNEMKDFGTKYAKDYKIEVLDKL
ncbi:winged helix-turn-helix transcriptional regulator [Aliarcobacter butzleri]|uniref:winged helix-turn-helix transcriptional regulator n=1 Tax=Aliarcobacter butzleri TaxID=28197 RepID=UPI00062E6953|nr:helix-turn-helix domain-containing protein [Aliarcobacter butzleri]KLD96946.1 HxlR family transcriptional regulator [Aliarcobacter butzleri L349]